MFLEIGLTETAKFLSRILTISIFKKNLINNFASRNDYITFGFLQTFHSISRNKINKFVDRCLIQSFTLCPLYIYIIVHKKKL